MPTKSIELLAIGNAIVDVIARSTDAFLQEAELAKGTMQLIDAERAEQLYSHMDAAEEHSGGSAANTVTSLAGLGHSCGFIGQVAQDQLGEVFVRDIRASDVQFAVDKEVQGSPTGRSLILVTPDGQRTMSTCLGASQLLGVSSIKANKIASAKALFLEGYLWDPTLPRAAMRRAIEIAKEAGVEIILTLSDGWLVERHRDDFLDLMREGLVDVLFANRMESLACAKTSQLANAISQLRELVPLLVVTDGANGAHCFDDRTEFTVAADENADVVDTTGAGDAFAAGFLSGYLKQLPAPASLELGTICATQAIGQIGPRPGGNLQDLVESKLSRAGWQQ